MKIIPRDSRIKMWKTFDWNFKKNTNEEDKAQRAKLIKACIETKKRKSDKMPYKIIAFCTLMNDSSKWLRI